MPASLHLKKSL